MVRVYIASPYWHENYFVRCENVMRQQEAADALISAGYAPFWPLHSHYLAQSFPRDEKVWLALSIEWIKACDFLVRLDGPSKGGDAEVAFAQSIDVLVFFGLDDLARNCPQIPDHV